MTGWNAERKRDECFGRMIMSFILREGQVHHGYS
jgi:hypothetical protein